MQQKANRQKGVRRKRKRKKKRKASRKAQKQGWTALDLGWGSRGRGTDGLEIEANGEDKYAD